MKNVYKAIGFIANRESYIRSYIRSLNINMPNKYENFYRGLL